MADPVGDSPEHFEDAREASTPNNNTLSDEQSEINDGSTSGDTNRDARRTLFASTNNTTSSPSYLLPCPTSASGHVELLNTDDVIAEMNEVGEGDSCASADAMNDLNEAHESATSDRLTVLIKQEDDIEACVNDDEKNCILIEQPVGDDVQLVSPPENWKKP